MRLVLVLTIICVISAFFLGFTYSLTADKIKSQEEMAEKNALESVISGTVDFSPKITDKAIDYYKAFNDKKELVGYAFVGEGKGYSSVIRVMIGTNSLGNIRGVKIISQNETPGLGTKIIDVKTFQEQFGAKPIDEVDTITGATISSRAVKNIVRSNVEKFNKDITRKSLNL